MGVGTHEGATADDATKGPDKMEGHEAQAPPHARPVCQNLEQELIDKCIEDCGHTTRELGESHPRAEL